MDKLVVATVQDRDASILIEGVTRVDFRVIKLSSSGGSLRSGSIILLVGIQGDQVKDLLKIIEENYKTREVATSPLTVTTPGESRAPYPINVMVGGATVFIPDVNQYVHYWETRMKMILAIVPGTPMDQLMDRYLEKEIQFTRIASSGGFLKQGDITAILEIEEDRLDQLKGIFEDLSQDLDEDKKGTHAFYMAGDIEREF